MLHPNEMAGLHDDRTRCSLEVVPAAKHRKRPAAGELEPYFRLAREPAGAKGVPNYWLVTARFQS